MTRADRLLSLAAVLPEARPHFEALIAYATARGWRPAIVSAVRTAADQAGSASRVSLSWHQLGRALDVELRGGSGGRARYQELGEWWEGEHAGVWGGRWTDLYPAGALPGCEPEGGDCNHFQYTPGLPESAAPWFRELGLGNAEDPIEVDAIASGYLASGGVQLDRPVAPRLDVAIVQPPGWAVLTVVPLSFGGLWILGRALRARERQALA